MNIWSSRRSGSERPKGDRQLFHAIWRTPTEEDFSVENNKGQKKGEEEEEKNITRNWTSE